MHSLLIGFWKLIRGKGLSKNKPTCENAVSQTLYGSCTLRVMGSCNKQPQQQQHQHQQQGHQGPVSRKTRGPFLEAPDNYRAS